MQSRAYMITETVDANGNIAIFRRTGPRLPTQRLHATAGGLTWVDADAAETAGISLNFTEPRPVQEGWESEAAALAQGRSGRAKLPYPAPETSENPFSETFSGAVYRRRKQEARNPTADSGEPEDNAGMALPDPGKIYARRRQEAAAGSSSFIESE